MRRRLSSIAPLVMVMVGLTILLYPTISNFLIEQNASRMIESYDDAVDALSEEERLAILDEAHAYNAALAARAGAGSAGEADSASSAESAALLERYNEVLDLNGNGMMGYISIPSIEVTLPIYHGVEEQVLQEAVGHIEGTSLPVGGMATHAVLSGHRGLPSAKLFTDLDQMQEGELFFIRVLDETFAYQVDGIETVLPDETSSLAIRAGEDRVTLVTCTPYGINSHRLLVHAHAVPYVPEMDELVGKPGNFINIPLPYLLLIIALAVLAVVFAVLRHRQRRDARESRRSDGHASGRGGSHFA
ncbi:putative uncharacterized protein [Collinsella sp. CAG:398]|nr:putative uncharacterized protein [Collinsella sp. CAG:398]